MSEEAKRVASALRSHSGAYQADTDEAADLIERLARELVEARDTITFEQRNLAHQSEIAGDLRRQLAELRERIAKAPRGTVRHTGDEVYIDDDVYLPYGQRVAIVVEDGDGCG